VKDALECEVADMIPGNTLPATPVAPPWEPHFKWGEAVYSLAMRSLRTLEPMRSRTLSNEMWLKEAMIESVCKGWMILSRPQETTISGWGTYYLHDIWCRVGEILKTSKLQHPILRLTSVPISVKYSTLFWDDIDSDDQHSHVRIYLHDDADVLLKAWNSYIYSTFRHSMRTGARKLCKIPFGRYDTNIACNIRSALVLSRKQAKQVCPDV
jgi:hypothetical protein